MLALILSVMVAETKIPLHEIEAKYGLEFSGHPEDTNLKAAHAVADETIEVLKKRERDLEKIEATPTIQTKKSEFSEYVTFVKSTTKDGYGKIYPVLWINSNGKKFTQSVTGFSNVPYKSLEENQKNDNNLQLEITLLPGHPKDMKAFKTFLSQNNLTIEKMDLTTCKVATGTLFATEKNWPRFYLSTKGKVSLETYKDLLMYPSLSDIDWK